MWCSFDGKDRQELRAGDAVIIRTSQWPIPTVCRYTGEEGRGEGGAGTKAV